MRIFSGIQPTGRKHLGNYIGAIEQYVASQQRGEAIFCIVDLHSLTVPWDPGELRELVYDTAAILIAAGLDPDSCLLVRQSDVPEHTELTWLLASVTSYGDLQRMHQFKEKTARGERELVSAGLFFYPVLMAADVLAYGAHEVPVGDDQRQHVELMRDVAIRFNQRFGEVLVVPEPRIPAVGARIMDLQEPESKMSTTGGSAEGTVYVLDEPAVIERKVRRAVTDSGSAVGPHGENGPGVANLIEILAAIRRASPASLADELAGTRYGELKAMAATAVVSHLAPVRERYGDLRGDTAVLETIFARGAERARSLAAAKLADVRRAMGVGAP